MYGRLKQFRRVSPHAIAPGQGNTPAVGDTQRIGRVCRDWRAQPAVYLNRRRLLVR